MPYEERYEKALVSMKAHEAFISSFIQEHLDDQAVAKLKGVWQEGVKPIPEDASFEEKYEVTYGNWVWETKNAYRFIRERLGKEGLQQFVHTEVEGHKREYAGPAVFLLRVVRAFSPGSAFEMLAKKAAYQMQWLTPFSVSELTQERAVFDVPRCKLLDFRDTNDMCFYGCQRAYPTWMAELFNVEVKIERKQNGCMMTLNP